jgi:hypothetical protein
MKKTLVFDGTVWGKKAHICKIRNALTTAHRIRRNVHTRGRLPCMQFVPWDWHAGPTYRLPDPGSLVHHFFTHLLIVFFDSQ